MVLELVNVYEVKGSFGTTRVEIYRQNIVRVVHIPRDVVDFDKKSFVVIAKPIEIPVAVSDRSDALIVNTGVLTVRIDKANGCISIGSGSTTIFREYLWRSEPVEIYGEKTYHFEQIFEVRDDEGIYGLGQHAGYSAHTGYNYRGRVVYLVQRNTDIAIPFMVSSKGYGVLWDMYSMGVADFTKSLARIWFEAGDALDFYFIYGPSIDDVISGYRWLTGKATMLPKYAFGYWQSKERYATQQELISTAKMFRDRDIPIDIIVQDWRYWGKYGWNAFKFDENDYPNPREMVKELHDINIRLVISIWPIFGEETEIIKEAEKIGCIFRGTGLLNVFKDECREWFWRKIEEVFFSIGIDGWWLDASEPEVRPLLIYTTWQRELDTERYGKMFKYINLYPLLETKAVYEGQRSVSNKRVLILTRSGFLGIQRYGVINWSGDITGDWTTFRTQIWAGLNYCASGLPYWTTDIGGFFSGNPDTEGYRELFIRWLQWGVFCPIFRVHGTYYPKEPWRFGSEAEKIIVKYIRLRYRLLPYIYSLVWKVYNNGYTIMRPLFFDYRDDPEVLNIDDQFMFGPYILVSPITTPSTYEREIYLPKGLWYDFWSGELLEHGFHKVKAPIDIIPLHVKAGAILPLAPISTRYSMQKIDEIELRIYRGRSTVFTLYEDDGETYDYEKGIYALIPIEWDEDNQKLIIHGKQGSYEIPEIKFKVVWVRRGKGVGIEESEPDTIARYQGEKIVVSKP